MTELPAGFVNPFLNSSGVLDFHSVAVYSFSPPDDFQEATNSQKQLNFTFSFLYLLFVAIFFFPQSSCDLKKKVNFYSSIHCMSFEEKCLMFLELAHINKCQHFCSICYHYKYV